MCVPSCVAGTCGQDDGCGGTCACPVDVSCAACPLRLVRVDQADAPGTIAAATLALEATADWGDSLPRLAEVQVAASEPVVLERVEIGEPLALARKRIFRFSAQGNQPFERVDERTWRVMLVSGPRNLPIGPGRWLTLHFSRAGGAWAAGPVSFHLVRAERMVAPEDANAVLLGTPFEQPVVLQARR